MKLWKLIEDRHTGETQGLLCKDCQQHYVFKDELINMERIKENFYMECCLCKKTVSEDYSICGECNEVYPKGCDERADNEMKCEACAY